MVFPPISNFAGFLRLFSFISKSYSDISKKFTKSKIIINNDEKAIQIFQLYYKTRIGVFLSPKNESHPV